MSDYVYLDNQSVAIFRCLPIVFQLKEFLNTPILRGKKQQLLSSVKEQQLYSSLVDSTYECKTRQNATLTSKERQEDGQLKVR